MGRSVAQKLLAEHRVGGSLDPGDEILIRVDQTLTQDATGTLVMLELEALGLDRVRTEISAQYVDHNLIQADHRNADDHVFLESACRRFGIRYCPPGTGVSHPVHQQLFGRPGASLLGADSHTCAAGSMGMLAIGAGGLAVAMAMAGEPFPLRTPEVFGVRLVGELPEWVSAKDVILEMLRRHGVDGGLNRIIEYHGPGLGLLSAMDRHVIANMGAELGATTTVFPSDEAVRSFLRDQGREADWRPLSADRDASFDVEDEIDLASLEPLVARPSSPGDVVPVREVAGEPIYQAYVGSSANPGYRDFAVVAEMVRGQRVADGVSFDVNPTSRQVLARLLEDGRLGALIAAGARLHQTGCNGCIGMGQAPASGRVSMRTVPRNFPGRSGTQDDRVYLCSPETAGASALRGRITDPRDLGPAAPRVPARDHADAGDPRPKDPLPTEEARLVSLTKGPNIASLPDLEPLPQDLDVEVALVLGDDVSTDEILPAGARVLPFRSNLPELARFSFERVDPGYYDRVRGIDGAHAVIGGRNYGQGSSREHAVLAPRSLGLALVVAQSFARIHRENLVHFGVLPLTFADPRDRGSIEVGDRLRLRGALSALESGRELEVENVARGTRFRARHDLSPRQVRVLRAGGWIRYAREHASTE